MPAAQATHLAAIALTVTTLVGAPLAAEEGDASAAAKFWPQWRGPLGTGAAPHADPPVEWGEDKNIRWKVELPGRGHSTPIVWGDRIFVTAAEPFGEALPPRHSGRPGEHDNLPVTHRHRFIVMAIDPRSGKTLWQKTVHEALPHEGGHNTGSLASASPVTDGQRIYAFFGSYGLYCLDFDGELLWKKQFGAMHSKHGHGEGTSPVLHGDTLIINWDHEEQSFLAALDKRNGDEKWRVKRDEVTSWSTPIVIEHNDAAQIIVPGTHRLRGYDLSSGKVIWECGGLSHNIVASPVAGHGMVYVGCSYDLRAVLAVRLEGAKGDITDSDNVVWRRTRGTPYVPSLLLYEDAVYFLAHYQNVMSRVNAKTGAYEPGAFRLGGLASIYASPVAAAARVYITDLEGATLVITHAAEPKVLALNKLNDTFSASAAMVGKEIFLRGNRWLYCIAEE